MALSEINSTISLRNLGLVGCKLICHKDIANKYWVEMGRKQKMNINRCIILAATQDGIEKNEHMRIVDIPNKGTSNWGVPPIRVYKALSKGDGWVFSGGPDTNFKYLNNICLMLKVALGVELSFYPVVVIDSYTGEVIEGGYFQK